MIEGMSRARVVAGVVLLVGAVTAEVALADGTVEAAREAYDRGAAAYDAGEYARAAAELARADEILANDVALELALKAAVKADDPRFAMTLVARADARQPTGNLAAARDAARARMATTMPSTMDTRVPIVIVIPSRNSSTMGHLRAQPRALGRCHYPAIARRLQAGLTATTELPGMGRATEQRDLSPPCARQQMQLVRTRQASESSAVGTGRK